MDTEKVSGPNEVSWRKDLEIVGDRVVIGSIREQRDVTKKQILQVVLTAVGGVKFSETEAVVSRLAFYS